MNFGNENHRPHPSNQIHRPTPTRAIKTRTRLQF